MLSFQPNYQFLGSLSPKHRFKALGLTAFCLSVSIFCVDPRLTEKLLNQFRSNVHENLTLGQT